MRFQKQAIVFIAILSVLSFTGRFLPHPANLTSIGALALIVGKVTGPIGASLAVIVVMLISDAFIGFYSWQIMLAVYISLVLYGLIGFLFRKYGHFQIIAGPIVGATSFFLITNFAVWFFSPLYPQTLNGLLLSYLMAVPFFKNMLVGDLLFTLMFSLSYLTLLNCQKIAMTAKMVTKLWTPDIQNVNSVLGKIK